MKSIIPIYKFPGETPLECINRFKQAFPEYQDVSITYAGRLDPMADGLLLLLAGEAVHQKDEWMGKDKTYLVSVLFGVETDTYDALGKIVKVDEEDVDLSNLKNILSSHTGIFKQKFPPYSAYKVQGKALFEWTREGKLGEIEIPFKEREIYGIEMIDSFTKTSAELWDDVQERIGRVKGDFRQDAILDGWRSVLSNQKSWQLVTLRVKCSSGTFMRSLAHNIGKDLGGSALAYSIRREVVGEFELKNHNLNLD